MKKVIKRLMVCSILIMIVGLIGCSKKEESKDTKTIGKENAKITLFAAKSLNKVMDEIIAEFNKKYPKVEVVGNYDSSGTLMTQIEEGASCDVFFSADTKQMKELEEKKLVKEGTSHNLLNNRVCVVTYKGSKTKVTGLKDMGKASSLAIAGGSVPVGKYTRQALVNAKMLSKKDDVAAITTEEISKLYDGIEINECANVGAVTSAVSEGANEIGTVYYSDTYGLEDKLEIVEKIPYDLTGDVIYPVGLVKNSEADKSQEKAAKDFINYLLSEDMAKVFEKYLFDVVD